MSLSRQLWKKRSERERSGRGDLVWVDLSYVHLLLNAINTITADVAITMATIPTTSTVPITGFVTVLTAVVVGWMIEVAVMVTTLPPTVVSFTSHNPMEMRMDF